MKYSEIKTNEEINALIDRADQNLEALGYTDHSRAHAALVAKRAGDILGALGYEEHQVELAKIAGYIHDIGNTINRSHHAEYGAMLANDLLKQTELSAADRITIVSAIAHHDESTGGANDAISAALILADKTDVRRNRVRQKPKASFDVHDRVNYAVTKSELKINKEKKNIALHLKIDERICTMYEYFDIFLGRMMMCRKAAEILGANFKLVVNERKIL